MGRIITVVWVLVWCLLYSRHVRFGQKEQINNHKVVAEQVVSRRRGSCREQGSFERVWFKVSTIRMLSDNEEDLGDFPTF